MDGRLGHVRGVCRADGAAALAFLLRGVEGGFLEGGLEVFWVEGGFGRGAGASQAVGGRRGRAVGRHGHGAAVDAGGFAGTLGVFGGVSREADWRLLAWRGGVGWVGWTRHS